METVVAIILFVHLVEDSTLKYILSVFCLLLLFGVSPKGVGAEPLTLEQAVKRALANYPTLQIQRHAIEEMEGHKTTSGLLPNPVISYYREDLSLGGQETGEWIMDASLPLDFLWTRWSKVNAVGAQINAETARLTYIQNTVTFEVQKAFVEYYYAIRAYQAWQKATDLFHQASRTGGIRHREGDISGYEQQRIALETLRYQKNEAEAEVKLINSRSRLAFLTDPKQSNMKLETIAEFPSSIPDATFEELLVHARRNRQDLQVVRAVQRVRQAELDAARRQGLPKTSVSLGYKKQVDGFKGAVVQVNLGLPLFNRNQGQVRSARAGIKQQNLSVSLLEKQVEQDLREAHNRYRLYRNQLEIFEKANVASIDAMLDIARFSYTEGEMSLVELLDGVRAYTEAFQTKYDLLLKYQLSIFQLEKATATPVTDF